MKDERKCTMRHFLLHDNAWPHSAAQTQDLITSFKWEQMDHTPYSPDLAPSDFHLFLHLKKFLGGKWFDYDDDLKDAVQKWLTLQAAAFYEEGIQKRVPWYDKCLNNSGEYVENGLNNVESDNNKISYETLLNFLQRNGTYFQNKPRRTRAAAVTSRILTTRAVTRRELAAWLMVHLW